MKGSIYDCIDRVKYVSKKKPTFEKVLASMSKIDIVNNLDADIVENISCLTTENVKVRGKDPIESALRKISEAETFVINEIQMTPEKAVDNEVIEEQMVNGVASTTILNNDDEPLPHDTDQPVE